MDSHLQNMPIWVYFVTRVPPYPTYMVERTKQNMLMCVVLTHHLFSFAFRIIILSFHREKCMDSDSEFQVKIQICYKLGLAMNFSLSVYITDRRTEQALISRP